MWPDLKLAVYRPALKLAMERMNHGVALGYTITRVDSGEVDLSFPYKEEVVGNPLAGVVHGGVIVSLLDTCCSTAAMTVLNRPAITPTIDLRLDYMRPAEPNKPIYVTAKVYRNTSSVIFCRGVAWQDDPDSPIAHCVANFMRVKSPNISFAGILRRRFKRFLAGDSASEVGR